MKKKLLHFVYMLIFILLQLVAQTAQLSSVQSEKPETETETITFHADKMSGTTSKAAEYVKLSGNAYIKTTTMEIYANFIELSGSNYRIITAQGNIRGKNLESGFDFTCGKLEYDRQTKIALLQESVTMDDPENEVIVKAQMMEYDQNTETALLQINVELKKKDNVCTAAFAIYRKKQKMLEMSGHPQVVRGADTFRAQEIIFNVDTEEISLIGKVSGSVTDSEESK